MQVYLDTLQKILDEGHDHPDRTGTGRRSLFGVQLRFNMNDGFPLVTTRKINVRAVFEEMFWFISGDYKVQALHEKNVKIWDAWAIKDQDIEEYITELEKSADDPSVLENDEYKDQRATFKEGLTKNFLGSIGPMYGYNWRYAPKMPASNHIFSTVIPEFSEIASDKVDQIRKEYDIVKPTHPETNEVIPFEIYCSAAASQQIDQLQNLILGLKSDPYSARHIVTSWIPEYAPVPGLTPAQNVFAGKGCLAACHAMFQCFVHPAQQEGGKLRLSLQLYQRSADFPVGSAFNIAQYALLLHLLAHVTDMEPYEFIYTLGDTHIYKDQIDLVKIQLEREPLALPILRITTPEKDLFKINFDHIELSEYRHHPVITYPVSA